MLDLLNKLPTGVAADAGLHEMLKDGKLQKVKKLRKPDDDDSPVYFVATTIPSG